MKNETLHSIREDWKLKNDGDRLREIIEWLLKSSDHLTWARLCACLREPIVARDDLANQIEKELKGIFLS